MDPKRPGGVLVVIVVGLLLGSLGTCGAISGLAGQLLQDSMQQLSQDMAAASSAGDDEMLRRQLEMQERMQEVTAAYRPAIFVHQGLNLLTSVVLVVACILLVRWSARGPGLFIGAAIASLLVDLAGGAVQLVMQWSMNAIMQDYMSSLTAGDPSLAGMERTMSAAMGAGGAVGICFAVGWLVLKTAFYVGGSMQVGKREVRELFLGKPPEQF